jgi:hypothetical protein
MDILFLRKMRGGIYELQRTCSFIWLSCSNPVLIKYKFYDLGEDLAEFII